MTNLLFLKKKNRFESVQEEIEMAARTIMADATSRLINETQRILKEAYDSYETARHSVYGPDSQKDDKSATALLTVKDASKEVEMSEGFIKKEIRAGRLVGRKFGKFTRIEREELERWIKKQ